ncbi:hypothetical protein [Yoonia sp.]|uniref:hypothetical protein n=1 Tax=Yoonia sp. TaxID=2212373 RepID=UPI003F6C75B6
MLKTAPRLAAILGLVLAPQVTLAAADHVITQVGLTKAPAYLIDLDTLTAQDKRRLDFYAGKIITGISEISALELTGDRATIKRKVDEARNLATRFSHSSQDLGLTAEEARRYFLGQFVSRYTGRLPDAMMGETGNFDLNALFAVTDDPSQPGTAVTGGYVDLLRDEDIGGIGVTD